MLSAAKIIVYGYGMLPLGLYLKCGGGGGAVVCTGHLKTAMLPRA
jgi:hypothetical protein